MITHLFDAAWARFSLCGTLITAFWVADALARRGRARAAGPPSPRWVRPLIVISVAGFYALIGPTGGALAGGAGNLIGVALAGLACVARQRPTVRHPDLGARILFYVALPLAVGTPWGLLALSLPACAASIYLCVRAERSATTAPGHPAQPGPPPRYRLFEGVW
jgi:protein-S-isoprenylcysteine O-methyltransferase Ste14